MQGDPMVAARFATTRFLSSEYGLYWIFGASICVCVFDADAFRLVADQTSLGTFAAPPGSAFEDRANVGCAKILLRKAMPGL